jgi:hypothetical protein
MRSNLKIGRFWDDAIPEAHIMKNLILQAAFNYQPIQQFKREPLMARHLT